MSKSDNPLKWLLTVLPGYIEPEALAVLMTHYRANKAAYERQIAMNKAERIIKTTERFQPSAQRDAQLTRWRAKLAKLKEYDDTQVA
jgi:hypothetical protein